MPVLGLVRIARSDLEVGEAEEDDVAPLIESDLHERIVFGDRRHDRVHAPRFADPTPVDVREISRLTIRGPDGG